MNWHLNEMKVPNSEYLDTESDLTSPRNPKS